MPNATPTLPATLGRAQVAAVGRYATRYPASAWLDLLAQRATSGQQDAAALIASGPEPSADVRGDALVDFAFVLAACTEEPEMLRLVADLYTTALRLEPDCPLDERTAGVWLQALHLSGTAASAATRPRQADVSVETWWGVHTDGANPHSVPDGASPSTSAEASWLADFCTPFTAGGHQPVTLRSGDGTPFDRLAGTGTSATEGPLVSVVVPVYNPTPSLLTSVRSLLAQSWRNLEVLLCDDASSIGLDHIAACADLADPRLAVHRFEPNAGPYVTRNRGLALAQGRFVTFQDADDYAHPDRIETHVRKHLEEGSHLGTVSHAIRASSDLLVTSIGMRLIPSNASSFMFEREPVLTRLGGYDTVRRAADTEFINRFVATFGADRLVRMDDVLAVIQATPGSLSRGDLGFLRRHPARQAYRATANAWHDRIRAGADPHVVPGQRAPFPAPVHITGAATTAPVPSDLTLLTSVSCEAPTRSSAMLAALTEAGTELTVLEFVATQDTLVPAIGAPDRDLARLTAEGTIRWALPDEGVRTAFALVDDPEALLVMPAASLQQLEVGALVVTFDEQHRQLVSAVEDCLAGWAHLNPVWLPSDAAAADLLQSAGTSLRVLEPARWWVGAEPVPEPAGRPEGEPPVVGTISGRFTSLAAADVRPRTCLPRDPGTQLWSWGPCPAQVLGRPVHRVRATSQTWQKFIRQVDYFVAPTTSGVSTLVMDAWSAGTAVLATDSMRDLLGNRAVYPGREGTDALLTAGATTAVEDARSAGHSWAQAHASAEALRNTYQAIRHQLGI